MSLATRCPACGTIFRVVQDQLKVSEGWVRCGQCHEVFHGIEQLFDLESDPTIAARRAARAQARGADAVDDSVPGFAPTRTPPIGSMRRASTPVPPPPPARPPLQSSATAGGSAALPQRVSPPARAPEPPAASFTPPPPGPFERTQVLPPVVPAESPAPAPQRPLVDFDFGVGNDAPGAFVVVESSTDATMASSPASTPDTDQSRDLRDEPEAAGPWVEPASVDMPAAPAAAVPSIELPRAPVREIPAEPVARPVARDAEGASTLPSRLVEDNGPETLASLLPEAPGDWPPKRSSSRRSKAATAARAGTAPRREEKPRKPRRTRDDADAPAANPAVEADDHPRFVREARRSALWNRPAVRASLWLALAGLGVGAAGQVAWPMRDMIAARWPATAPVWDMVCEQAGCTIQAPRSITSLTLDGSTLTRTETDHVLLFSADLRNKALWNVRTPAFDLKFTDLGGQVVARRVFEPADLGIGQAALAPDTELHVRARLKLDGIDAVGFQAEIFYP